MVNLLRNTSTVPRVVMIVYIAISNVSEFVFLQTWQLLLLLDFVYHHLREDAVLPPFGFIT